MLAEGLKATNKKMSDIFPLFEPDHLFFQNQRLHTREEVKKIAFDDKVQSLLEECRLELGEQGRVVIHPSGTEPKIRIWVCGDDKDKVEDFGRVLWKKIDSLSKIV